MNVPEQLRVEGGPGGAVVVSLSGELDKFAVDAVRARMNALPDGDPVIVDLSELSFIDSAGLHCLFAFARGQRGLPARLAFVVPASSPVRRVLEIVHLDGVSPMCETLERACELAVRPAESSQGLSSP